MWDIHGNTKPPLQDIKDKVPKKRLFGPADGVSRRKLSVV